MNEYLPKSKRREGDKARKAVQEIEQKHITMLLQTTLGLSYRDVRNYNTLYFINTPIILSIVFLL